MLKMNQLTLIHAKDMRELVHELSITINSGDKVALIGEEGTGKSTLMRYLIASEELTDVILADGQVENTFQKFDYLPQQLPQADAQKSISDFFYQDMDYSYFDFNLLYRLADELEFDSQRLDSDQLMGSLSGGERLKVQLLKLLPSGADLLLLDEPSNDLDLDSVSFLQKIIQKTEKAVIFISHDETLLSHCANKIIHLEYNKKSQQTQTTVANLDYQSYKEQRQSAFDKANHLADKERRDYRKQMDKLRQQKSTLHHALGATKDSTAGRLLAKKMKNIKSHEQRFEKQAEHFTDYQKDREAINISFNHIQPLAASKAVYTYGRLTIYGQDKICIIGANGVGKSTLLREIWQGLQARDDLSVGYMPQNYQEILDDRQTPLQFLESVSDSQSARTYLASLQFTRQEITHDISQLSGGQKAKLLLAKMLLANNNVLILDEPTRNFSATSQAQIRQLLEEFPGCLISVSHDRAFIEGLPLDVYQLTKEGLEKL